MKETGCDLGGFTSTLTNFPKATSVAQAAKLPFATKFLNCKNKNEHKPVCNAPMVNY